MSSVHARTVTKLSVLREASMAGATLKGVTDVVLGHSSAVDGAITALFGGSLKVDAFQCFHLETSGVAHMFVQPYAGVYTLPGEHHAWLQGTLRAPAQWQVGAFSDKWISPDPPTAYALEQNPGLRATARNTRWEWRMGSGEINYAWTLQCRPFRGGLTHLAMKATGELVGLSGLHQSGFIKLLEIARVLQPSLAPAQGYPAMPFLVSPAYAELYERLLDGRLPPSAIAAKTPPSDFAMAIVQALSVAPANKLLVHPLAPVKDNTIRSFVLPPAARHLPIVAFVDTTLMGSAKDGLAFTPTHGFLKNGDFHLSFAWPDVRAVQPPTSPTDGHVVVSLAGYGEIALPSADRAGPLAQLMRWFSQMP